MSALLSGPLTFSSEILNFSSFWICFESCPTASTVTFFEICAEASKGNAANAMVNSLFIINRSLFCFIEAAALRTVVGAVVVEFDLDIRL